MALGLAADACVPPSLISPAEPGAPPGPVTASGSMDRACLPDRRNDRRVRPTPLPLHGCEIVRKAVDRKPPALAGLQPCHRAPAVCASQSRPQAVHHLGLKRLLRFAHRFRLAHCRRAFRPVSKRRPSRFGPAATLAHMLERCRVRLRPRLVGTGEQEFQVRTSDDRCGQDYSACRFSAGGTSASVVSGCVDSSADFRFTALILPRLSCWRS